MPRWPKQHDRPSMDRYGRTVLWDRAAAGDVDGILAEIADGAEPSAGDDAGYTPLHVAVQNGHLAAVQALLDAGANPNSTDKHGNGPLWTATHHACLATAGERNISIVRVLIEAGANPHHLNNARRSPFEISERRVEVRETFASAALNTGGRA